jgi:hypothetical protein
MKHQVKSREIAGDPRFVDKRQLAERLNLPSIRSVDNLIKLRRIPVLRWGHRTVRFDMLKVEEALRQFEVKAVGQK